MLQIGLSTKGNVSKEGRVTYNTSSSLFSTFSNLDVGFNLVFNLAVSADYLYDFWEKGDQTLGISAGLGYI